MLISIDYASIEAMTLGLRNACGEIQQRTLGTIGDRSTITANQNLRGAFDEAQKGHLRLAEAVLASATQIETIAKTFAAVDFNESNAYGVNS